MNLSERIQNSTRIGHVTSVADLEHLRADQLLDCSVDGVENRGQKVCHTFPILMNNPLQKTSEYAKYFGI